MSVIVDEQAMHDYAARFAQTLNRHSCIALYGDLGAGKTFFVRAVCTALGFVTGVRSPTFTLMNIYEWSDWRVYHMDLYRLTDPDEIYDIGYDDCVNGSGIVFIEWPEKIEELLPENVIRVNIEISDNNSRQITVS